MKWPNLGSSPFTILQASTYRLSLVSWYFILETNIFLASILYAQIYGCFAFSPFFSHSINQHKQTLCNFCLCALRTTMALLSFQFGNFFALGSSFLLVVLAGQSGSCSFQCGDTWEQGTGDLEWFGVYIRTVYCFLDPMCYQLNINCLIEAPLIVARVEDKGELYRPADTLGYL